MIRKLCLAALFCATPLMPGAAAAAPSVAASYECLWWAPAQMVDLDPNKPPPKATPTPLSRWEYSDPVGVPHPDVVTLVVHISAADAAGLTVRTQWLGKTWSPQTPRQMTAPIASEGATSVLRYDIPIGPYILAHEPKRFRSSLYVAGVKVKDVDLAIQLGD
jgi:hypothetical protein